jgi:sulfate permease, SulP family
MFFNLLELAFTFDKLCSTIISQVIYSAGASGFAGANGSMMIEVVVSQTLIHRRQNHYDISHTQPFFHIMATHIAQDIGEEKPYEIVATTLVAFAFSSLLTGMTY